MWQYILYMSTNRSHLPLVTSIWIWQKWCLLEWAGLQLGQVVLDLAFQVLSKEEIGRANIQQSLQLARWGVSLPTPACWPVSQQSYPAAILHRAITCTLPNVQVFIMYTTSFLKMVVVNYLKIAYWDKISLHKIEIIATMIENWSDL